MAKINKDEMASRLSVKLEVSKAEANRILDAYHAEIRDAILNGDDYGVQGLFTVKRVYKEQSEARNPQNGEKIIIPAHNDVKFKASDLLRKSVAKG